VTDEIEFHPVADIFPMMSDREFDDLVTDIAEHGLREPVWLHGDGRIVDGRNRYRACIKAGVSPSFRTYQGDDSRLVSFVVSLNLHRRHLSESQRAMVAARIARLPLGANQHGGSENFPTQAEAAVMLSVSDRSIRSARKVHDSGVPELAQQVEAGKVAVSTAATIADAPPEEQREVIAVDDEREIIRRAKQIQWRRREERRQHKAAKVAKIAAREPEPIVALGPFQVIYADPPWRYDHERSKNRMIENHYPTMDLEEIKALEVPAADDSVLFLWVTSPKLREGIDVVDAWGFDYRTCMIWVKDQIGMGYYARQQHELLLIAKRGQLKVPDPEDRPNSVVNAPRTEHSAKPDTFYELIERMYPFQRGQWCELFARSSRDGWVGWGNQVEVAL
jgi:N6-adenosine-specific RNA methylase IME4